jgi:hypothetical protein
MGAIPFLDFGSQHREQQFLSFNQQTSTASEAEISEDTIPIPLFRHLSQQCEGTCRGKLAGTDHEQILPVCRHCALLLSA